MKPLTKATAQILAPITLKPEDRLELTLQKDGNAFTAKIFSEPSNGSGTRGQASFAARHTFIERMPERSRLNAAGWVEAWEVGATDTSVTVISTLWPKSQIVFNGADTATMYNYLVTSSINYDGVAEITANYSENKTVPPKAFPTRDDVPLAPYQIVATAASLRAESYALFCEPGTGKTAISVTRICADAMRGFAFTGKAHKVLIVCPKNVRTNWVDEFEKFQTCKGRSTVVRGGQLDRVKCLIDAFTNLNGENYTALIIAYDSMVRMLPALRGVEWDIVLLDESHYIKSSKTKRAHAAMELRDIAGKKMILTGSPITNTPLDLYSQLEFLGKGCSGFTSFAAFKRFYGVFDKNPETGFERLVAFQNMPFMRERLARYSFIIRKEQALPNLPAKVTNVIEVEMTAEQRQVYDDLRKTLAAEIEGQLDRAGDNVQLVVTHALTKLLRLAQITSGFLPFTTETDELTDDGLPVFQKGLYKFTPNPKLDALVEFIKSHDANSKTIVWATWVHDIKAIAERLELEGITAVTYYGATRDADREAAKLAFNSDPNCKVFIGNAAAGGTGINLLGHTNGEQETNADHVVFYSQGWSAVQRIQAEDRAHRRGTRAPVTITDLCVAGTIDEEIRARVTKKRIMAFEISDVREILRAVLRGIIDDE